jgi:thermolysin
MRQFRWLGVCAAVALAVWVRIGHAQTTGMRPLRIVPDSASAVRDWDNVIGRMIRAGELRVRLQRDDTLLAGRTIEQLAQFHKGIRVWGGNVSRQLDGGRAVSLFGTVYEDLDVDVTPVLGPDAAEATLTRFGPLLNPASELELVILPDADGVTLAWMATVRMPADVERLFIDARSGAVVRRYGRLHRQLPATSALVRGVGVLGDEKKVSVMPLAGTFVASDTLRPPVIETYDMRGNLDKTLAVLLNLIPLVSADLAANSSTNWVDAAVVDAHAYAAYTYDYYYKRFGRRGLDNANRRLVNLVHPVRRADIFEAPGEILGTFYLNAFYCGDCAGGVMMFGEGLPGGVYLTNGQRFDYLAGALDIVAHELTHGVTDYSSQLEYINESGALNEAFSDIMGTSVEFFFQPAGSGRLKADYLIGEDVVTAQVVGAVDGVRSMADPARDGQPDHYSKLIVLPLEVDNGGVHVNSGIPNHVFYLAIEGGTNRTSGITVQGVGAANRDQIEKVFYRAFAQLLPSNANFSMARAATLQAAQDLYGVNSAAYNAVRNAWTAVGVN